MKVLLRAIYLFSLFLPVLLTSGLAYVSPVFRNMIWFNLLYKSIAYSGAAFIKWGQWASTRPDMFPISLCNVLENLQSNSPQHSYSFTRYQIEMELKAPIEQIFEKFEKVPIASGSIAQVYKAVLNGKDVAVKVRHPNVGEQIEIDFIIMKALATFIDSLPGLNWINLKDSMAQFSDTISSQIRLDIEGRHLYQFNNNFDHWKDTKFPEPIIMTESVLVESFEEGQSVKKYADIFASKLATAITMKDQKLPTFDKTLAHFIVTRGEDIYLKMLLNDNLMHADLHPGNIIIRVSNDNKDKEKYKIVLVDAGMVAELLPEEQRNFIGLLEAIGDGDGADAAECLLRFSSKANYTKEIKNAFKRDIIEMFKTEAKGYGNNVSIGKVLRGVLNIVRIHKVSIDANYATLVMNSLCLDGLAQSLYPRYNILDNAKPLLRLSRMSRKVIKNRKLSSIVSKIFLPLAQWLKKRGDKNFLAEGKKAGDDLQAAIKNLKRGKK